MKNKSYTKYAFDTSTTDARNSTTAQTEITQAAELLNNKTLHTEKRCQSMQLFCTVKELGKIWSYQNKAGETKQQRQLIVEYSSAEYTNTIGLTIKVNLDRYQPGDKIIARFSIEGYKSADMNKMHNYINCFKIIKIK